MEKFSWVCLGSAFGGGMRYLVSLAVLRLLGPSFPFGTLTVNIVGSFLIGVIMHVGTSSTLISPNMRLFLTTGIMGGFTTYSAFNFETLESFRSGAFVVGLLNISATVLGCLAAGLLGLALGRWLVGTLSMAT